MPVRATKRGAARVPFADRDARRRRPDLRRVVRRPDRRARAARDGRARARARPLRDRRAPDLGVRGAHGLAAQPRVSRPRSGRPSARCSSHTPRVDAPAGRCRSPSRRSTTAQLCALLWEQGGDAEFETAKVERPHGLRWSHRPRRRDGAADRRRARLAAGARARRRRPAARGAALARPGGPSGAAPGDDLELWIDPRYVDAGYGWSFPARDEVRIGVGSFDPHDHVKQPTLRARRGRRRAAGRLPGQLDPAPAAPGGRGRRVLRRRLRRATACR